MGMVLPWEQMDAFLQECGKLHQPMQFSVKVVDAIEGLIPYEQARLYVLDKNGLLVDAYLVGVDEMVAQEYFEYYSKVDGGAYGMCHRAQAFREHYPAVEQCLCSWESYNPEAKFFQEYVRPNQIRHCFGLPLRDADGFLRGMITLDRVSDIPFSKTEIEIMRHIRPHTDNLYQNFYVDVADECGKVSNVVFEDIPLTARELEIARMLKRGLAPSTISKELYISITTVRKHIQNIHEKLNVSSHQQLMIKLMDEEYV